MSCLAAQQYCTSVLSLQAEAMLSINLANGMQVFQEMVWKGCERSVITYSSLISACEKAGHWELAMELFNEMHQEGCTPNTVTYNSLITACAQGRMMWHLPDILFTSLRDKFGTKFVAFVPSRQLTASVSCCCLGPSYWQRMLLALVILADL